jgi:hypothetical protein
MPPANSPLVTKAPSIGFNLNFSTKNFLIMAMCVVFTVLFFYDGFYGYPTRNDRIIQYLLHNNPNLSEETRTLAQDWKGWASESAERHEKMDTVLKADARVANLEGWKSPFDVRLQRLLAAGLILATVWALWRLIKFLRLRVQADDLTLSPHAGLTIPWDKITQVDNTRWHTDGIVHLTYSDAHGNPQQAEIDEYKLDPKPLLPILELLAEKAVNAEFLPKETTVPPS